MKETKKTAAKAAVKAEAAKVENVVKNAAEKAAPVVKAAEKKATAAAKAVAEKKVPGRKPAVKANIAVQFAGKSYTTEDLLKIAKDVWKYDLSGEEKDFKSVDLFVKPEEKKVYYVINGDVYGNFAI